jgi:hypothetical protein
MQRIRQRLPAFIKANAPFASTVLGSAQTARTGTLTARGPFAIHYHAARRINRQLAEGSHIFLLHQIVRLDDLQPGNAAQQKSQTTKNS